MQTTSQSCNKEQRARFIPQLPITMNTSGYDTFPEVKYVHFLVNGTKYSVDTTTITPKTTLNEYLRNDLRLTGTKYMCKEGGCGACMVSVTFKNPVTNSKETKVVNSCLVTVVMVDNWEIITIESLGNRKDGYDTIQQKVIQFNATQCGFCTPGMVITMYDLQQNGKTKMADIEAAFGGNLCRCTGYRSILSAFKSMASDYDPSVLGTIPDIEDLHIDCAKSCSTEKKIKCMAKCKRKLEADKLATTIDWYRATCINDIFDIFDQNSGRTYQLVAGNTAQGVYKDIVNRDYFIDINEVKELKTFSHDTRKLSLGGNITLNEVITICREVSQADDGFKYLEKVALHVELIAHNSIRNIGTLAGNLCIKYLHNSFPSDIFLLLETVGAKLVIDNGKQQRKIVPSQYLDFDMRGKIIHSIELPPLAENYHFQSYKIMKRAQNAHAIINAGFLFKIENKIVEEATIVYGGVNPQFIHAVETEKMIRGKVLYDNQNMQAFFAKLLGEIQPDNVLPQPSPEFRRKLCVSLLYKYILSIAPSNLITEKNYSGRETLQRPEVSMGVQDYKTDTSMYPIGEPIHKLEAADQASGQAQYFTDTSDLFNQTFAVFVQGRAPPGSILREIDASHALEIKGVIDFFQASDIPGVNSFMVSIPGLELEDEPIFLEIGRKLRYFSQPVGLIVAETQRIAEEAIKLVRITFSPATTVPILSTKDAVNHSERVFPFNTWLPKSQNTEVPVKLHGVFESLPQYHNHIELQVASVEIEDNGDLKLNIATQWMDSIQSSVSRAMNIPAHRIHLEVKRIGGSFGGRINRPNRHACAATLAALKLQKPVKLFLSMEDNMDIVGKRYAVRSCYDVGVDNKGVIGYLNNNIYTNTGSYRNAPIEGFVFQLYEGPYITDTFYTDIDYVKTDNPAATYMRSPGYLEGSAIIENIMDHIACKLKMDPVDVRLANLKDDADLKKILADALDWSDYKNRRRAINEFNLNNAWRKKGIGICPMVYTLTGYAPYFTQVSIYQCDGTVAIAHGGAEVGQGLNTKIAQVAAYVLDISIDLIRIWPANNLIAPNNFITGGSVTSESLCISTKIACTALKTRIEAAAANLPQNSTWPEKVLNAFANGVSLTENGIYEHDAADPTFYVVYGVGISEIELDVLTGQIVVQRADILEDTASSLNPFIDIGQVEGAFVMALGHWTSEEIITDDAGQLLTNNTWEYKIPGAKDIPVVFRVKFPEGIINPLSPFNNKATGEPPCNLAYSVPLAIRHALQSVRTQFDPNAEAWTSMEGPCSVEWIFLNSNHDIAQYKL